MNSWVSMLISQEGNIYACENIGVTIELIDHLKQTLANAESVWLELLRAYDKLVSLTSPVLLILYFI